MNYQELSQRIEQSGHGLCIGIDPDPAQFPEGVGGLREFCLGIIDSTADVAVAYKPNFAFFEALGRPGWDALDAVTEHLRRHYRCPLHGPRQRRTLFKAQ